MNKPWKVILVFIGVFLSGAITGGIISYRWVHHPIKRPNIERFTKNRVMHLSAVLKCTPEQKDKLEIFVVEASMNLRRLRQNSFRTAMAIFDRMDTQIETVLNPEQRIKFQQLREAEKARFHGFIHAGPVHPASGPNGEPSPASPQSPSNSGNPAPTGPTAPQSSPSNPGPASPPTQPAPATPPAPVHS